MRRLRWSSAAVIMDGRIGVAAGITADTDIAAVMVGATVADMVDGVIELRFSGMIAGC
jgi:hypothetical protein